MNPAPHDDDNDDATHGPQLSLFRNPAGEVSACRCGAVTLTMQHMSLRFTPDAFRALTVLLATAQARLDRAARTQPAEPEVAAQAIAAARSVH